MASSQNPNPISPPQPSDSLEALFDFSRIQLGDNPMSLKRKRELVEKAGESTTISLHRRTNQNPRMESGFQYKPSDLVYIVNKEKDENMATPSPAPAGLRLLFSLPVLTPSSPFIEGVLDRRLRLEGLLSTQRKMLHPFSLPSLFQQLLLLFLLLHLIRPGSNLEWKRRKELLLWCNLRVNLLGRGRWIAASRSCYPVLLLLAPGLARTLWSPCQGISMLQEELPCLLRYIFCHSNLLG
ncbi:hypothetical protein LWI28_014784 [Acer negundo]|uniref:Uncharacterized protein n=1 Tax=Acer negundo TaxID=4023 RepID=A0AAD5J9M6_ACENE|nr:hypothetical protein LWI28_014784 [Acer negundo]